MKYALIEIERKSKRAFLAILGYALIFSTIVILVSLAKLENQMSNSVMKATGTHFILFLPSQNREGTHSSYLSRSERFLNPATEGFLVQGSRAEPISLDLIQKIRSLPEILDASPFLLFRLYQEGLGPILIGGLDISHANSLRGNACSAAHVISGKYLDRNKQNEIIVEESSTKSLSVYTGETLRLLNEDFIVRGVANTGIIPTKADLYLNYERASTLVASRMTKPGMAGETCGVLIEVKNPKLQETAIKRVRMLLPNGLVSSYSCYKPAARVLGFSDNYLLILIGIVIISGISISAKSQTAALMERKRDLAIMRVLGWRDNQVSLLIMSECALQSFFGSMMGIIMSLILIMMLPIEGWLRSDLGAKLHADATVFLMAVLIIVTGGVIASLIAIRGVLKERPKRILSSIG